MANTDRYSWNVQIDDTEYLLEYMKGSIYINGGEAFKLRSLERTGTLRKDKQLSYTVPLAGKELNLVISAVSEKLGIDAFTFYYAGDNLDATQWDERSLKGLVNFDKKKEVALLAFELALRI